MMRLTNGLIRKGHCEENESRERKEGKKEKEKEKEGKRR